MQNFSLVALQNLTIWGVLLNNDIIFKWSKTLNRPLLIQFNEINLVLKSTTNYCFCQFLSWIFGTLSGNKTAARCKIFNLYDQIKISSKSVCPFEILRGTTRRKINIRACRDQIMSFYKMPSKNFPSGLIENSLRKDPPNGLMLTILGGCFIYPILNFEFGPSNKGN